MTKQEKRLKRIRQNPKNVRFEELQKLLEDYGFVLDHVRGSHYYFIGEVAGEEFSLTIPFHRPHIKLAYVKLVLNLIARIEEVNDD